MFIIPNLKPLDFDKIVRIHLSLIATEDLYYQNSRMLRGPIEGSGILNLPPTMKILTHEDFRKYLDDSLDDIELVTECIEAFVPSFAEENDINIPEEENRGMFTVNRVGPEYEEIKKRMTQEKLKEIFPPTHNVSMTLLNNPEKYDIIIDDIYVSWSMHRYIRVLDTIRMQILDNMTPAIEFVVNTIDAPLLKRYIHTSKINDKKVADMKRDMFFIPDYKFTCEFYNQQEGEFKFDLDGIMKKLISNIDVVHDRVIVISLYLTASFAMADIRNKNYNAPCVEYVRDVLAKIK